jgi:hypothetical protein
VKRDKIIMQLASELAATEAALGDHATYILGNPIFDNADTVHGYWVGRKEGLRQALTLLMGTELPDT